MAKRQTKAQPRWKQYVARYYADALEKRGPEFFDPETADISEETPEFYQIIDKIVRGKYGEVFEGIDIQILECVDGGPNIVRLIDIIRDADSRLYSFVFEEVENIDFKELYPSLNLFEIKYYLYQLLKSLEFSHQMGIMHRDIKPHNVMIDHSKHKLRVIDWGLAEFYQPFTEYSVNVESRHYKGPELLLGMRNYDYSLDMWSFGCILGSVLFKKYPFFKGKDDEDQLVKITHVLGTDELRRYCDKYQIQFEISGPLLNHRKKNWEDLKKTSDIYNSQGQVQPQKPGTNLDELITPDGLRLLTRLLVFDHDSRLSAKQTLEDEYFAEVRQYDIGLQRSCGRDELEIYKNQFLQARKDGIPFDGLNYVQQMDKIPLSDSRMVQIQCQLVWITQTSKNYRFNMKNNKNNL
ncbi:MAG: putative Casein kinase II subunit alpha [Streblomastix strix]|uniref:non-specific serine/threonine protein kinase n=1 Tax=Streblomastix strix TaxID=222440 RepID=A0A5J4W7F3_9EUKA|nr:MAG: putative Casein kinase II subunit alpha [Streblomastix strix]